MQKKNPFLLSSLQLNGFLSKLWNFILNRFQTQDLIYQKLFKKTWFHTIVACVIRSSFWQLLPHWLQKGPWNYFFIHCNDTKWYNWILNSYLKELRIEVLKYLKMSSKLKWHCTTNTLNNLCAQNLLVALFEKRRLDFFNAFMILLL